MFDWVLNPPQSRVSFLFLCFHQMPFINVFYGCVLLEILFFKRVLSLFRQYQVKINVDQIDT